jgi:hypothetical protein
VLASFPPQVLLPFRYFGMARWRSARGVIKWLGTQGRWNPEVAITFGAAARYCRAAVGRSHDDAHPSNSTLHTGAARLHTGFVGNLFFISPRTGHGSSKVFRTLPAFSCIQFRGRELFVRGVMRPYFLVGPSKQREALVYCLDGLVLLEYDGAPSPWRTRPCIITALALNRSAHRRS